MTIKNRRKAKAGNSRYGPRLARILSPMAVSEFLGKYFNRKPLFIRGRPGKFDFMFKADELMKHLDKVTEITAVFPRLWQARIEPADVREMVNAGATICARGLERGHAKLEAIARAVEQEIGYSGTVDFRAYLSPPGTGFDLHFDARVATTLQIAGQKRWWYADQPAVWFPEDNSPRPGHPRGGGPLPAKDAAFKTVLLRPGDLLCLPAGIWHAAKADERSSLALNMAFNYLDAGILDFLVFALRTRLQNDPEWRRPLVLGPDRKGKIVRLQEELTSRGAQMQDALAQLVEDAPSLLDAWNVWSRGPLD